MVNSRIKHKLLSLALGFSVLAGAAQADLRTTLHSVQTETIARAQKVWNEARQSNAYTQTELRFLRAVLMGREGDLAAAERVLRSILANAPDLDVVRYELVQVLAAQRKFSSARLHLAKLNRPSIDPAIKARFRRLDRQYQSAKPWRFSFGMSVEPTDNINRATQQQSVEILGLPFVVNAATAARAGVRTNLRFGAERRFQVGDKTVAGIGGFVSRVGFGDIALENLELGATAFASTQLSPTVNMRMNLAFVQNYVGRTRVAATTSGGLSMSFPITKQVQHTVEIRRSHYDYTDPTLQDGATDTLSTHFQFQPSSTLDFRIGASAARARALRPQDQFDSLSLSLGLGHVMKQGLLLDANLTLGTRSYLGINPLTGTRQSDDFGVLQGSVTLSQVQIFGLSPKVSVRYEKTESSFAAKSFDAVSTSISFQRSF